MKTNKKDNLIIIAIICSIVVTFTIILIGISYYRYQVLKIGENGTGEPVQYQYHYAIISDEIDLPFWEAVYEGAYNHAKEQNAYVERIGSDILIKYSLYDLMNIAIDSKVDGIILEANNEPYMVELINEAESLGITVITVMKDSPQSHRKSYVGINSYHQGQSYGRQVLDVVNNGRRRVTVLMNSDNKDTSQNIIYSTIKGIVSNKDVLVETAPVNSYSTFSSEEDIRKIIMDSDTPPDVLVCLTAEDTLGAYQAVVDYNKVGEIDIIGSYDSELILAAIEKEIIHSTITIDAEQMGVFCINALTEYIDKKRVSEFYSIKTGIITADNVAEYIEK
ncbi:MAG TPA: sugar ABC transporter substrate-binding protein [Clostridiales bacterium]|nr:sugar ABC transporter substrate-binding protein [Clostridiales bacterium]